MRLIDCQSHVFSPEYMNILLNNRGFIRVEMQDDWYNVRFGELQTFRISLPAYGVEKKIADMDRCGVDVSVISPNIPGPELLQESLREPAARLCNEVTSGLCARFPHRLVGLAVLPFTTSAATLSAYRYAVDQLDLRGVVLYSHINGRPVDDPEFEHLYQAMAADSVPIVFHPTVPHWGAAIRDYWMIPMAGLMVDHSFAMLRLILGGVLERNPTLSVVQPHCGGVIPYLLARVDEQTEVKKRGREHIKKSPSEYYRSVYLDIVSPSPETVKFALSQSGANRLLFATDHPWVSIEAMKGVFESVELSAAERTSIAHLNAERLFRIPPAGT